MSSVGTDVRVRAAEALGQCHDARAVPALMTALNTTSGREYGLRCTAAAALANLGDRQAVPALIEALKRTGVNGEGPEVVTIIKALGTLRDPQAVPILLEQFHSFKDITHTNVTEVPEEAGKALALIGGPEIVPAVVAKLSDPDVDMRRVAARTLGRLLEAGDPKALAALQQALSNDDWGTRMEAVAALKAGGATAMPALIGALKDPAGAVGGAAAESLSAAGPAAVPALIAALKSPTLAVRASAAKSLGAIGDERAKEPLRAATGDQEKWVRDESERALREHGW
jgi:HEAT repeat protein